MKIKIKKRHFLLLTILIIATFLRFYGLTRADVITDENLLAFRSIGYIDYFASPYQTTPLEWLDPEIPGWTKLSFHDHPPLFFIIHFLFFKILGVSIFVMRLPEVIAGIASVFLLYLIGKQLFSPKVGLVASAMMAITAYPVWISKIALQESLVIFFNLLTIYFFIIALKNDKFFLLAGASLGLGLLTKYTVLATALVCFLYLIIYRREIFLKKNFYFGVLIVFLLFSPVIIYNLKLYQTVGHFDLQLSYLLGQDTPKWQNLMGKPTGNYWQRVADLVVNLRAGLTPTMFYSSFLMITLFIYIWFKKNSNQTTL
jgi:4-amino-4-deoxy-L-arabinose transferase-like glycosyltransferase